MKGLVLLLATLAAPVQANGDPARGAAIAASRSQGLCVLCHALPGQPAALAGTVGPPLAGVASRLDVAALRARLLEPERFNPDTVMPAYGRTDGLQQVAPAQRGKPLLSAAQIDDVLAWLVTLQ
jgi:sulfur-oxidizing protein SoxX